MIKDELVILMSTFFLPVVFIILFTACLLNNQSWETERPLGSTYFFSPHSQSFTKSMDYRSCLSKFIYLVVSTCQIVIECHWYHAMLQELEASEQNQVSSQRAHISRDRQEIDKQILKNILSQVVFNSRKKNKIRIQIVYH